MDQSVHFQYVIINLNERMLDELNDAILSIGNIVYNNHATHFNVTKADMAAFLGYPFPEYDSPELRAKLVSALLHEYGASVRLAHGQCKGKVVNMGSDLRSNFAVSIPKL